MLLKVQQLKVYGTKGSVKHTVSYLLRKVIADEVLCDYSAQGRTYRGVTKLKFSETYQFKAIKGKYMFSHCNTNLSVTNNDDVMLVKHYFCLYPYYNTNRLMRAILGITNPNDRVLLLDCLLKILLHVFRRDTHSTKRLDAWHHRVVPLCRHDQDDPYVQRS